MKKTTALKAAEIYFENFEKIDDKIVKDHFTENVTAVYSEITSWKPAGEIDGGYTFAECAGIVLEFGDKNHLIIDVTPLEKIFITKKY